MIASCVHAMTHIISPVIGLHIHSSKSWLPSSLFVSPTSLLEREKTNATTALNLKEYYYKLIFGKLWYYYTGNANVPNTLYTFFVRWNCQISVVVTTDIAVDADLLLTKVQHYALFTLFGKTNLSGCGKHFYDFQPEQCLQTSFKSYNFHWWILNTALIHEVNQVAAELL